MLKPLYVKLPSDTEPYLIRARLPRAAAAAATATRRSDAELAAAGAFNTLANLDSPESLDRLARVPFGEVLLDKWRGVASGNGRDGSGTAVGSGEPQLE